MRVVESAFLPVPAEFDRLRVVLVATRNPLNIGAAARAMSNFGFLRLRVVIPYEAAFREARSAVGASALLSNAEEYKSVAEAVADCTLVVGTTAVRHRELQHPLRRLEYGGASSASNSDRTVSLFCLDRRSSASRTRTSAAATGCCASQRAKRISR